MNDLSGLRSYMLLAGRAISLWDKDESATMVKINNYNFWVSTLITVRYEQIATSLMVDLYS